METPKVKTAFSQSEKQQFNPGKGCAKQEFKQDCDLNHIIARMTKTGQVPAHIRQGQYVQQGPTDLHQAMNIVAEAKSMFQEVPSEIRREFDHDPIKFLEFVNNPDNAEKASQLGIGLAPEAAAEAISRLSSQGALATPTTEGSAQPSKEGDPSAPSSDINTGPVA